MHVHCHSSIKLDLPTKTHCFVIFIVWFRFLEHRQHHHNHPLYVLAVPCMCCKDCCGFWKRILNSLRRSRAGLPLTSMVEWWPLWDLASTICRCYLSCNLQAVEPSRRPCTSFPCSVILLSTTSGIVPRWWRGWPYVGALDRCLFNLFLVNYDVVIVC
jgi:hypothetical protein